MATYFDAADEAGRSRLYGGIHHPCRRFRRRKVVLIAAAVWDLGVKCVDGVLPKPIAQSLHEGGWSLRPMASAWPLYGVGRHPP